MSAEPEENQKALAIEYFQSGMEKFLEGYQEQAKTDFLLALEFDPTLTLAYCYLSSIYSENDEPDVGVELCEKGLTMAPEDPFLHFCLGAAFDQKGLKLEAIKEYEIYHRHYIDDAECIFSIACAYDDLGDFEMAKEYYRKAIRTDTSHYKGHFNLALLEAAQGGMAEAMELLKKAVKIDPEYWKAWVKLGVFSSKQGLVEQAIHAYNKAVEIHPGLVDIYYNLGISYRLIGQFESAIDAFKTALEKNPDDINALYNLGVAFLEIDETENAIQMFQQTISLNLQHEEAHYRLGYLYFITGEMEKAKKEASFLSSIDSTFHPYLENLICGDQDVEIGSYS